MALWTRLDDNGNIQTSTKTISEEIKTVALTIKEQLGGAFAAMTGAHTFLAHSDGLSFKLPPRFAKQGIGYIRIKLNELDTYDLEFGKIRGTTYTVIQTDQGVYVEDLRRLISDRTGLDLNL